MTNYNNLGEFNINFYKLRNKMLNYNNLRRFSVFYRCKIYAIKHDFIGPSWMRPNWRPILTKLLEGRWQAEYVKIVFHPHSKTLYKTENHSSS